MPKRQLLAAAGALLAVLGLLWTGQGLGLIGGSAMSGKTLWAVIGPIVALGGAGLIVLGLRRRT